MTILKNLSKASLFDKLILVNLALVGLIIWLTINESPLVSNVFYVTFFVLVWSFLVCPFTHKREISKMVTFMSILSIFNVIISSIIGSGSLDFNYMVNYFAFVFLLLYIMQMSSYKPSYDIGLAILWVGIGVASIYAISFYVLHLIAYDFMGYFTMNFSNPNLLAMFLYQSVLFCFVSFFVMSKYWQKALCAIVGISDFNLMMMADSRNCLISIAMVVVASVYLFLKKRHTINSWILKVVAVFPFLFVWFYLNFITAFHFQDDTMLSHDGKNVMSRVQIWNHVFDNLDGLNFIFGNYPVLQGNLHNSHLSVLGSFGVVVAVMFVIFLYKAMKVCSDRITSYKQAICLVGFMGTLFIGMAEGALVCGSLGLYIPACIFICLSSVNWETAK